MPILIGNSTKSGENTCLSNPFNRMISAMQKSSLSYGVRYLQGVFYASTGPETVSGLAEKMEITLSEVFKTHPYQEDLRLLVEQLQLREADLNGATWIRVEWKSRDDFWSEWSVREDFQWVTFVNLRSIIHQTSRPLIGVDVNLHFYFRVGESLYSSGFSQAQEWETWRDETLAEILRHKTLDQWLGVRSVDELSSNLLQMLKGQFPDLIRLSVRDQHRTFQSSV